MQNKRRSNRLQKMYSKEEEDDFQLDERDSEQLQQEESDQDEPENYEYSSDEGEYDSQDSENKSQYLTQRQRLMQERKQNQNTNQQYLSIPITQKQRKKKKQDSIEIDDEKKLVNEIKRKELMVKNQKQKLEEAIARILNLRDTKKVMKNNNEYKNKKNVKRYKLNDVVQKYHSNRKRTILKTKIPLFSRQQRIKSQNQKCKNCGQVAKYRMPLKFIFYCSLDCYKVLKKQLNIYFQLDFISRKKIWSFIKINITINLYIILLTIQLKQLSFILFANIFFILACLLLIYMIVIQFHRIFLF